MSGFNLIEFDNQSRTDLDNASYVKITHSGKYYLSDLIYEFAYLDSIAVDTPISDKSLIRLLRHLVNENDINTRLKKTNRFLDYLVNAENEEFRDSPQYIHSGLTNHHFASDIRDRFYNFKHGLENTLKKKV